ncbi:MAG: GDP-mannose 4,6-dehydratase [bacterium]|nr:GDP-mannose 4,6-dehydratase [bacterium]
MTDYRDFYRGKKVLITGGLGFIGSNLAHALVRLGAKVTLLDALLPQYGGNPFNVHEITDRVRIVHGDIRDPRILAAEVPDTDVLCNLAAQVSYVDSTSEPFLDVDINCVGHLHVLEAVRRFAPNAKVCFSSSRLVYGKILTTPVDESHPTQPLSIYGVHKLTAEKYHRIYYDRYGIRTATIRIPNPYGPRQQMKHSKYSIVGWFIRQAFDGGTLRIFGDGEQERDYLYVDDIVDAFLRIGATDRTDGEVYNIGSPERVRFVDMVDEVIRVVGNGRKEHVPWPKDYERNETGSYRADTRKISTAVGWEASVPLSDGIGSTVDYYREFKRHYW